MKLLRFGQHGQEKVAVIDSENKIRDLSSHIDDLNPETINFKTLEKLNKIKIDTLPEVPKSIRIGPCINRPSNILCIGLNYSLHAEQTGSKSMPRSFATLFSRTRCSLHLSRSFWWATRLGGSSAPISQILLPRIARLQSKVLCVSARPGRA